MDSQPSTPEASVEDARVDVGIDAPEGGGVDAAPDTGTTWVPPAGWWDENWKRRYQVRINTDGLTEELTDVPIMIELRPDRLDYALAGEGGAAVRMVQHQDGSAEELDFEIERWASGGTSVLWVRVPRVALGEALTLHLYLDNPFAESRAGMGWVWDSDFRGVWHLNGGFQDSTDYGNAGGASTATSVTGRVAGGREFVSGSHSTVADADSLDLSNGVTISAWVHPSVLGHHLGVMSKRESCEGEANYALFITAGGEVQFEYYSGGWRVWRAGRIRVGEWAHVAASFGTEERRVRIFVNGVGRLSEMSDHRTIVDENPIEIGANGGCGGDHFEGSLDELRLSAGARSEAWLWFQHRMSEPGITLFSPAEGEGL